MFRAFFLSSDVIRKKLLCWQRTDQHDHLASFHLGKVLNAANVLGVFSHPFQQFPSQILVGHFAATEPQGHLYLVAIFKKLEHVAHFDVVVVYIGVRAEFYFLDLNDLLFLARFGLAFLGFVFELPEIHDLANRRVRIGRDLDQIQPGIVCHGHCACGRNNANIFTISADQADFGGSDILVYARAGISLRRRVMWSAGYGIVPLVAKFTRCKPSSSTDPIQVANHSRIPAYASGRSNFPLVPAALRLQLVGNRSALGKPEILQENWRMKPIVWVVAVAVAAGAGYMWYSGQQAEVSDTAGTGDGSTESQTEQAGTQDSEANPLVDDIAKDAEAVKETAAEAAASATDAAGKAAEQVSTAVDTAKEALSNAADTATEAGSAAATAVTEQASTVAETASDTVSGAAQVTSDAVDSAVKTATGVAETTSNAASTATDAVTDAAINATEAATNTVSDAASGASDAASDATQGATDAAKATTEAAGETAGGLADLLTVDGFNYDKVVDAIDGSDLGAAQKLTLKTGLESARDNPALLKSMLDQVKSALGL